MFYEIPFLLSDAIFLSSLLSSFGIIPILHLALEFLICCNFFFFSRLAVYLVLLQVSLSDGKLGKSFGETIPNIWHGEKITLKHDMMCFFIPYLCSLLVDEYLICGKAVVAEFTIHYEPKTH